MIDPTDPNHDPVLQILKDHYDAAVALKATPTDALKSTFISACLAPTSVAVGL